MSKKQIIKSKLDTLINLCKNEESSLDDISNIIQDISKLSSRYTEAQKKATQKYRDNNREKYNQYARNLYYQKLADPEYRAKRKEVYRQKYLKKKEQQNLQNENLSLENKNL